MQIIVAFRLRTCEYLYMATTSSNLTPLQIYQAALAQLSNALDELDQAHSLLKEIGCHQLRGRTRHRDISQALLDLAAVEDAMDTLCCDSCGKPVSKHEEGECEDWSNGGAK